MGPSFFNQKNQYTTCLSASGVCGLIINRFGIKYSFQWLYDQRDYRHFFGLQHRSDIVELLTSHSVIKRNPSDILWIRPNAFQLMINRPMAFDTPKYDYLPNIGKWILITNGHLILFPLQAVDLSTNTPGSASRNLHLNTAHSSFVTNYPFRINKRNPWINRPSNRIEINRPFHWTTYINSAFRNELAGILEAAEVYFQGVHETRLPAVSKESVFDGRQNDLRKPIGVAGSPEDQAIAAINYNRPLTKDNLSSKRSLAGPQNGSQQLEYPLSPAGVSLPLNRVSQALKGDEAIIKSISPVDDSLSTKKKLDEIADTAVIPPPVRIRQTYSRTPAKLTKKRKSWAFYAMNLLLLGLIGFVGYNTYMTFFYKGQDPANVTIPAPSTARSPNRPDATQSAVSGYNAIWQRDLFHVTTEEDPNVSENESVSFGSLAYADKDVGVVLLGTIVSDDPELSRAIIGDHKGKKQEAYRVGDTVGDYQIKKIMLGKIVIGTEEGNKLLAVLHKNNRKDPIILGDELESDEEPIEETSLRKRRSVGKQRKVRRRRARVTHVEENNE